MQIIMLPWKELINTVKLNYKIVTFVMNDYDYIPTEVFVTKYGNGGYESGKLYLFSKCGEEKYNLYGCIKGYLVLTIFQIINSFQCNFCNM